MEHSVQYVVYKKYTASHIKIILICVLEECNYCVCLVLCKLCFNKEIDLIFAFFIQLSCERLILHYVILLINISLYVC